MYLMSAISNESSKEVFADYEDNVKTIAKSLLVLVVIVGLVAAVFFSTTALMSFAAAGAAGWQIGLTAAGCAASSISLLGSGYFAAEHDMFRDTGENVSDAFKFLRDTLGTGFYAASAGINIVREWQIWDMITSQ